MSMPRILAIGLLCCMAVYLFVTAPPELDDRAVRASGSDAVTVERLFNVANSINDAARLVYTKQIVGGGKAAGLEFGENWAEPGVEKGPLPALFLRLVAARLETKPEPLGLYLGSDQPINKSNIFTGRQLEQFLAVKDSGQAAFGSTETGFLVGMYPDLASAQPCVTCHNDHPDSPKTDWKLGDIMGATTWTYPKQAASAAELLAVSDAVFTAVEESYQIYLDKAQGFASPVATGPDWPTKGMRVLPDAQTFMAEVRAVAAARVLDELIVARLPEKERHMQ